MKIDIPPPTSNLACVVGDATLKLQQRREFFHGVGLVVERYKIHWNADKTDNADNAD